MHARLQSSVLGSVERVRDCTGSGPLVIILT